MTSKNEFSLRPFQPGDAAAVVAVVNAAAGVYGRRRAVIDGAGKVRLARYVPADSAKVVATNEQGDIVAYAYLADIEQKIVYEVGGAVRPDVGNQGLGARLLTWAEAEARRQSAAAPAGVKTVLQVNLFADEKEALQLFREAGFAKVREWLHLAIDFTAPPPAPVIPAGLQLRPIDLENDWEIVGPAMEEAYADHWGTLIEADAPESEAADEGDDEAGEPEDESYSNAPEFCFLLLDGDLVAGGVLSNGRLVESDDAGRIGSLFVRPAYRRRGVGRALMQAAFRAFWQHGLRRVITDTDAQSFTSAPKFYADLGMRWYRQELLLEKEIRPGREVRRLA